VLLATAASAQSPREVGDASAAGTAGRPATSRPSLGSDGSGLTAEQTRADLRRDIAAREARAWLEQNAERAVLPEPVEAERQRIQNPSRSPDSPLPRSAERDDERAKRGEPARTEALRIEPAPIEPLRTEAAHLEPAPIEGEAALTQPDVIRDPAAAGRASERLSRVEPERPPRPQLSTSLRSSAPSVPVASVKHPSHFSSAMATIDSLMDALFGSEIRAAVQVWSRDPEWRSRALLGLAGAALLAIAARALRQRGDLTVHLVYPPELRGTFRVRVHKRQRRRQRARAGTDAEVLKGGRSGTYEHFLIARETHFRRLLCGRYYLTVEGVLQDPRDDRTIEHPLLQATATVRPRRTVRIDVDATPAGCPVDVSVTWEGRPVRDALISPRAQDGVPVEAAGGRTRLYLAKGHHTIAAGSGDRVGEYPIHVRSHLPTALKIDLARRDALVFRGCPPAIELYLAGRFEAAAEALSRDGQGQAGHRMLARLSRDQGREADAAMHCEAAGDFEEAAELGSLLGNYSHAGELFERAQDPLSAAEMYLLADQKVRAGQAFETARDFEKAIECYRDAGAIANWVEALERRGESFEAARIALDNALPTRGHRLLQRVLPDDRHYREACVLLADAFEKEHHYDLAASKLENYIAASKRDEVEPVLYWRVADLHEKSGHLERALDVLDELRLLDPTFPNLATHAEQLRKAQSAKRYAEARLLDADSSGPPTVLLADKRYEILEEIGRGGMGVVFRARDRRLGRIVALKRLSENLRDHARAVQLFMREAQAAAALNHPNIVTIYDVDQDDGALIITMELLEGLPLNRVLAREGQLPSNEVARIGFEVCGALAYAHGQRVIHRDIKTANLFHTNDDAIKIMDFGLAKLLEEVRRTASVIGGTPYYMAPEQSLGADVDHRADLYALGATLFELATGRVPFPDGDTAYHNRHTVPPNPREFAAELDPALGELILQLLEKDRDDRPESAAVACAQLRSLRGAGPGSA
jgi:tRNA A-37 threonylcarbamoyl transferase component Bud32/TPR repeat protein